MEYCRSGSPRKDAEMDIGVQKVYVRGIASLTLMWERKEERMSRGRRWPVMQSQQRMKVTTW